MPDFVDPYLEPASGILRNRLGLTDRATLDRAEAELTEWRRAEMITRPVKVTGDLRQLQAIHRQLFQDVYDWAGERELLRQMHHSSVPHQHSRVKITSVMTP